MKWFNRNSSRIKLLHMWVDDILCCMLGRWPILMIVWPLYLHWTLIESLGNIMLALVRSMPLMLIDLGPVIPMAILFIVAWLFLEFSNNITFILRFESVSTTGHTGIKSVDISPWIIIIHIHKDWRCMVHLVGPSLSKNTLITFCFLYRICPGHFSRHTLISLRLIKSTYRRSLIYTHVAIIHHASKHRAIRWLSSLKFRRKIVEVTSCI